MEKPIKIKQLIDNSDFNVNCQYEIYDCSSGITWQETEPAYSTHIDTEAPSDDLCELYVCYVTMDVDRKTLIIEGRKESNYVWDKSVNVKKLKQVINTLHASGFITDTALSVILKRIDELPDATTRTHDIKSEENNYG